MIVLSSLLFLLFLYGILGYLCVVSLVSVSLCLKSFAVFPIFLHVSYTQSIFPIGRPLHFSIGVFWSPIAIRASVEFVILERQKSDISDCKWLLSAGETIQLVYRYCYLKSTIQHQAGIEELSTTVITSKIVHSCSLCLL